MKRKFTFLIATMVLFAAMVIPQTTWGQTSVDFIAGTNATSCTVNGNVGMKLGTSTKGGDCSITVPANATQLTVYAAAWKGATGLSLNITVPPPTLHQFL